MLRKTFAPAAVAHEPTDEEPFEPVSFAHEPIDEALFEPAAETASPAADPAAAAGAGLLARAAAYREEKDEREAFVHWWFFSGCTLVRACESG